MPNDLGEVLELRTCFILVARPSRCGTLLARQWANYEAQNGRVTDRDCQGQSGNLGLIKSVEVEV